MDAYSDYRHGGLRPRDAAVTSAGCDLDAWWIFSAPSTTPLPALPSAERAERPCGLEGDGAPSGPRRGVRLGLGSVGRRTGAATIVGAGRYRGRAGRLARAHARRRDIGDRRRGAPALRPLYRGASRRDGPADGEIPRSPIASPSPLGTRSGSRCMNPSSCTIRWRTCAWAAVPARCRTCCARAPPSRSAPTAPPATTARTFGETLKLAALLPRGPDNGPRRLADERCRFPDGDRRRATRSARAGGACPGRAHRAGSAGGSRRLRRRSGRHGRGHGRGSPGARRHRSGGGAPRRRRRANPA